MRPTLRPVLVLLLVVLALATVTGSEAGKRPSPASPPTIVALLEPPDGAVLAARPRPTFAWEATPGGRFRVQFSTSRDPFLPTVTSGRRATPGDRFKPSGKQWRRILSLAAGTNPVYWRVVALHMSADQVAAAPISSFTVNR